jgi:iron(III) transport system ATP-binding protein
MSGVLIQGLQKTFPGKQRVVAIDDVTLDVEDGEFLVLLGPSGCGKTTTLRCLAGLESPDGGRIAFGDRTVFDRSRRLDLPPDQRDVGMVFQSYALWPHKTVRENIAYPLRARRMKEALRSGSWVEEAAALVDCGALLDRYPSQLSGGQQQRVALARALVARPSVMLLDEPLSNLDARLRDLVRGELHDLHRKLGFTGVYVTHDQVEALAIADRIAVMRAGAVDQLATPKEIFERPATEYVAGFVGFVNAFTIRRAAAGWETVDASLSGFTPAFDTDLAEAHVRVRPDDLEITPAGTAGPGKAVLGGAKVIDHTYTGRYHDVLVQVGEVQLRAHIPARSIAESTMAPGAPVDLAFDPAHALTFEPTIGRLLPTGVAPARLSTTAGRS